MKKASVMIGLLSMALACNPDPDITPERRDIQDAALTAEELKILDESPDVTVSLGEIFLPNGKSVAAFLNEHDPGFVRNLGNGRTTSTDLTPQNQKNLLIARMMAKAHYLTDRSNYQVNNQNGLAYVYGGKDLKAMKAVGECNEQELVGLDCSGFIYQLAQAAEVRSIPQGSASTQGDTARWNKAFRQSAEFTKLRAERINGSQISASQIISGDLIYWIRGEVVTHTGIALYDRTNKLKIFQSNGTSEKSNDCESNKGPKRGPRAIHMSEANLEAFGDSYYIIRPTADISGNWTLRLRCAGQSTDALATELIFKTKDDNSFTATGTGTDYTGEPLKATIKGLYNKKENILEGDLEFFFESDPSQKRVDHFKVVLNEDETPYTSTTKKVDNGGCSAEVKLINKETND